MRWLADTEFQGERAFAAHTGMQTFSRDVRWRASDAEEGILLGADGRMRAVMPGQTVCPARVGMEQADLFVFRRGGALNGVAGAGDILDGRNVRWGGFGQLRCTLLLPRLALPAVRRAYDEKKPLPAIVADIVRPALRRAMEQAVNNPAKPAQLRKAVEELAFEPMRELLILHGLLLESFEMERFERTEEYHA